MHIIYSVLRRVFVRNSGLDADCGSVAIVLSRYVLVGIVVATYGRLSTHLHVAS